MGAVKWNISAGAVLLLALMYFFDGSGLVSALAAAALFHEAGHYALLRVLGARVTRVSLSVFGLEMDYAGMLSAGKAAACIAAGPAAGVVYALAAHWSKTRFGQVSGAVSLALTCFNLLPVLPLDGGRLLCAVLGERRGAAASRAASLVLAALGLLLLLQRRAAGAAAMGLWLACCNFRHGRLLFFPGKWYRMASLCFGRKTWTKD